MHSSFLLAALAVNVGSVVSLATRASSEPCAQVSAALANHPLTDVLGNALVDADLAYACLQSVPLDKAGDLKQFEAWKTLINFQSDLAYQKAPTPGWLYPGLDFIGSLESIITNLQNGVYTSEYDAQLELYNLVTAAYDFHLVYRADILSVFSWERASGLVSVSVDGTSLPNVYDSEDLFALAKVNGTMYKTSPVVQINDTDVEAWLNQYAAFNPWDHDPDVNYNSIFTSPPASIAGNVPTFQISLHFPGSETVLKFANGTTKNIKSYAATSLDFTGVTDGQSFFQKFCTGPKQSASASASASATISASASSFVFPSVSASASVSVSGSASAVASSSVTTNNLYTPLPSSASLLPAPSFYPQPAVFGSGGYMGGYFPENVPEVAVVAMPSFQPADNYEFQNAFRTILATAKSLGKKQLIIDVRGNGGGNVVDAFGLFLELFPSITPYGGSNMAAWPLFNAIGQTASNYSPGAVFNLRPLTEFNVDQDLTVDLKDYGSWMDFYGPVKHHDGQFTNIKRYNYSSPLNSLGNPIPGYGNDTKSQPQTFTGDNIVLLSDGACGSTCAIFAELLKTQGGVKSIAVGGRKQYGPQQPVGGSKGSNDQDLEALLSAASGAYMKSTGNAKTVFEGYIKDGFQEDAEQLLGRRASWNPASNVNFQNNIRKGDASATPLMYVYEAANCRFFYTPQMITNQSLVWKMAYDVMWGSGSCVKDSTGEASAATGYSTGYIGSAPPTGAKNFFGANITWSFPGAYHVGEDITPTGSGAASSSSGAASASLRVPPFALGGSWAGMVTIISAIIGVMVFML